MSTILDRITGAWTQAWGDGDTAAFESLVSPDYVRHSKSGDEDLAKVVDQIEAQHRAFTDFGTRVVQAVEDGDVVAILWETSGTHTGEFMGVPPTGRSVTVSGASFITHRDGRIVSEAVVWDPREMLSAISIWHLGDQRPARRRTV